MTTPWHPADVALIMRHVETCACRYVYDRRTTEDVKLIDVRCIGGYLTPDAPDTVRGRVL